MNRSNTAITESSRDVEAIVSGDHGDPFGYLGMHQGEHGELVVRSFQPDARSVHVIEADGGRAVAALKCVDPAGLFAGPVPGKESFAYRLRVDWSGNVVTVDDPYRFPPVLTDFDLHLLAQGSHLRSYEKLGARKITLEGVEGWSFVVWAPNARRVSVVGDFNNWDGRRHPMRLRHACGMWEIFIPELVEGARYKYEIKAADGALLPLKADPYALYGERPPLTASVLHDLRPHTGGDEAWTDARRQAHNREAPIAVYEVHAGSWRRRAGEGNRSLTYREMADEMVSYVADMGFTHVEFMPLSEHPFDGSWGYQPVGLFAPTSRFGAPEDFRYLVDALHHAGIGVIMDWVPGHFPNDPHGLAEFDGTHLYEHADPRMGRHVDWDTLIYNYGRREVANFLLSSALFWLDRYHIDGLRVDAVASMLYLDYSRKEGEWLPNRYGGRENLEAIDFIRRMNALVYEQFPGAETIAEESTAWPMVSRPAHLGGLGFGFKWNMGWMHDTLAYIAHDPVHRGYHHDALTFSLIYAFHENFVLPLSHDEVVHGKGSLIGRMPGDRWQRFANLRAYFAYMYGHPGKKLLFMGGEFAQEREWNHDASLDWHLLDDPMHRGVQRLVRDLNRLYRERTALHQLDCEPEGFEWIDANDREASVISFIRRGKDPADFVVVVCNFTPVVRRDYRVGVPQAGAYVEILNTDGERYGGGNVGNGGAVAAQAVPAHGRPCSLSLVLPPLATLVLAPEGGR